MSNERKDLERGIGGLDDFVQGIVDVTVDNMVDRLKKEVISLRSQEDFNQAYMSRREVKRVLHRCDATLIKWAKSGFLVPLNIGGKCLYKRAEVMRMLNPLDFENNED